MDGFFLYNTTSIKIRLADYEWEKYYSISDSCQSDEK